jgi:Phosphotransferase enzyme family
VSTAPIFPNPEREWERAAHLTTLERGEVERRIGPTTLPLELLPGGQANINVRIGADRVLRIYLRDGAARGKEHALLARRWESFVTPCVLDSGDDFLLLDYVPHGPLLATAEHGASVGRALAEIHRMRFDMAGFLNRDLTVCAPFGDIAEAFRCYARTELERASWLDPSLPSAIDELLMANADRLRREAAEPVLLHGDFKASNLHWTTSEELLVLDWEFAYAGPALMDIAQLLRWTPPSSFVDAFAESYTGHGGSLPLHWKRLAGIIDLVNLAGLAAGAKERSGRMRDIRRRMEVAIRNIGG